MIEVEKGQCKERLTLPIGPLRLMGEYGDDRVSIDGEIATALATVDWLVNRQDKNFYIVGGSWRAVSRVNLVQKNAVLQILHGFSIGGAEAENLAGLIAAQEPESLAKVRDVPSRRAGTLPLAALILQNILKIMKPKRVITSSLGLREGIAYKHLSDQKKQEDPFISAAREMAEIGGRFKEHGDRLMDWIAPVFKGSKAPAFMERLYYGTCLLSDIAWRGHPDFRAERAMMEILYGRFVGVDHRDRGFVGLALNQINGGSQNSRLARLCRSLLSAEEVKQALVLGAALRLGHRVSGGTSKLLKRVRLKSSGDHLVLEVDDGFETIVNDVVERRLKALADQMHLTSSVELALNETSNIAIKG
ncbi:hypothetical protein JCM17844_04050 [Iodidimonas gelatinilytica]|uniref:Uncharacterized protein n=2 Tax=Iodidimonas gelatinilytica TaxID=1236966 RepID=A0A5A7MP87_9PROT|nr:hypothetical protein JCM17844_04050 [Iodidimonas gelatinilytica]